MEIFTFQTFKDFAAPVATIIASLCAVFVTGYFAWHQKELAKEKLRLDLYDRRLAIFNSVFDFYNAIYSWKGTSEQIAMRTKFFRACGDSKFLFKEGSEIEATLRSMFEQGLKVIDFKENINDLKDNQEYFMKRLDEHNYILEVRFHDGLNEVRDKISKYLNFHKF